MSEGGRVDEYQAVAEEDNGKSLITSAWNTRPEMPGMLHDYRAPREAL